MDLRCRIELFGELRLIQQDRILTRFSTRKVLALLAYLALHLEQTHAREQLLELFWPEMTTETARANLRTTLNSLRNQLEPPGVPTGSVLIADRQSVRLNPDAVSTDVAEFDRLIALAARRVDSAERIALLDQATTLYRADLLPTLYDDWALREQDRCRNLYRDALRRLSVALEESGAMERALDAARRFTHEEPGDEEGCRLQMRLCLALGQTAAALESYQTLERYLRTEFGVTPERETREMLESLRGVQETSAGSPPRATQVRPQRPDTKTILPMPATTSVPPDPPMPPAPTTPPLPLQLTRYVGREAQKIRLVAKIVGSHTRLVTLLGPGGIGKTRLAVEVAEAVSAHFAGRVWFVSLADCADRRLIPAALVNTLKLQPGAHTDPMDRIVEALGQTPCLLVLDNFEHLLWETPFVGKNDLPSAGSGAVLVRILLERIPGLRCLVTSRQILQIEGEQEFPLSALALPDATVTAPEHLLRNESIALFTDRAQAVKPDFVLTAQNIQAVIKLCHKLDGIPLAIEMVAAWASLLTPAKMLERLEHQFDLLVDRRLNRPQRHQSLRATFEWSYERLEPELRAFFARLSVFRGGWTLEAAEFLCQQVGAEGKETGRHARSALEMLSNLQGRSLLLMTETDDTLRYRLLEPLREFATEKLQEAGEWKKTALAHAHYFLHVAAEAGSPKLGSASRLWLDRMDAENDNFRSALDWCLTTEREGETDSGGELGLRLVTALTPYWKIHSYLWEGRDWMAKILSRTQAMGRTRERAQVMRNAGMFALLQGDQQEGRRLGEECFAIYQELQDTRGMMSVLGSLAGSAIGREDYLTAQTLYEQALELQRTLGTTQGLAISLTNLGTVAFLLNDLERARALHEEALQISRNVCTQKEISLVALNLGIVVVEQGDFARAKILLEESLERYGEYIELGHLTAILERFGCLANVQGDSERMIKLCGASATMREAIGYAVSFDERPSLERHLAIARSCVGEEAFATMWAAGQSMTRDQAIAYALEKTGIANQSKRPE